jgi:hypothetical protein
MGAEWWKEGLPLTEMKSTASLPAGGRAIYFIKDLKEEPAPHVDAGFFRHVYGVRNMYLSR